MVTHSAADRTRGQAMVEFALVLPILALLLLLAVDFGRVFFGWVGLQNAARIGASYAALEPMADYSDPLDPKTIAYNGQIAADTAGINCILDSSEPPQFPSGKELADPVTVNLSCDFALLTPFVAQITGSPIELNASATFPIRSGVVGGSGGGGGGGGGGSIQRTIPDLVGMTVADARLAWETAGFLGDFSPASGQDDKLVTTQTTTPAASAGATTSPLTEVDVTQANAPNCSGTDELMPKVIGLTVADARARWIANGFPATGFTPSTGFDDQVVVTQTESPDVASDWAVCVPITTTLTVTYEPPSDPLCLVPDLVGVQTGNAQATWEGAGFETAVQFDPPGSYRIVRQNVVRDTAAFCETTVITVGQ